jgi:hypothetical protein
MPTIAPSHKAIALYYAELAQYDSHGVAHELARKTAFQSLLSTLAPIAPKDKWMLVPELAMASGRQPDGTLQDDYHLPRGYWEAKDLADDLDTEIRKKIAAGYPLTNTIFEDTHRAVLYQGGKLYGAFNLVSATELANLLNAFFGYTAPVIESFAKAVAAFREQVPELAAGLRRRIQAEHAAHNPKFAAAWASFYGLCKTSLDPNMRSEQVDVMLVQHLLTERLFRTVFENRDFTRRNVIAAEIEKVIDGLTSRAFNRDDFLRTLDPFYVSIEQTAKGLTDWSQKQGFMNIVYERFFQGYDVKDADTHGIVYTPQEIVDFMCASVEEVLRSEFGTSLSEQGVQIVALSQVLPLAVRGTCDAVAAA